MATKSNKQKKPTQKSFEDNADASYNASAKEDIPGDDDNFEENLGNDVFDEKSVKKSSGKRISKAVRNDDEDDGIENDDDDDWNKGGEEEEWDPDFEEFDLPKSRKGKADKGDDEDFKFDDDEFKDLEMFNDEGFDDEEEDF
ncbi:MAG: hypothetical protein ICV66_01620 [Chitinophagaceae bacterium]|nr:hypothetical protein [Chitinophagaceae bacterium]